MKNFQDIPAFWRYFGARFKPFTRPLFLGSVGVLTLSGITLYQYWHHPDWLHNQIERPLEAVLGSRNSQPIPPVLEEEDLAVLADVDNIELLLQEMEQSQIANSFNSLRGKKKKDSPNTAFSRFQQEQENKFKNASATNSNYLQVDDSALNALLKPPSLINYSSNLNSKGSNPEIMPNPVGRLYVSKRNSPLGNSNPSITTNPLTKLGDRSGNFNIRRQVVNVRETENISNNQGNIANQNQIGVSNTALNQPTSVNNNFSNGDVSSSPLNNPENSNTATPQRSETSFQPNNLNRYSIPSPNYNRSVPNNYQLQPSNFGQQTPRNFNQINSANYNFFSNSLRANNQLYRNNSLSNPSQNQQQRSSYNQGLPQPAQLNNQPIINRLSNPSLQPAGSLSTSPLRR